MKKVLACLFLLVSSQYVFAQPTAFSTDSVKFLKQVIDYLGDEDKSTAKEFKEKFESYWFNAYTDGQKNQVYKMANGILAKGCRPFPDFYDFMQALYGIKANKISNESFTAWSGMVDKVIAAKDRKQLPDFLRLSAGLFTQGVIFETAAVKWRCKTKNFSFEYDKQPRIVFPSTDLVCYAKGDSSTIYNTSGVYFPVSSQWEGKGGRVTWLRAGLDTTQTYAKLKRYKVTVKTPGFDADSVLFHTPYFKKPLAGEVTEKVLSISKATGVRYPQFTSYSKRLFIKDFYPAVDYEGGFTVQGADIVGSGTNQQMAKLMFYRNNKVFLKVSSTNLILNAEDVTTDRAKIAFYVDNDSITHPGINFKYIKKTNQVTMFRIGQGIVMSPFYDSYHKLELSPEGLYWKVDEPVIELKSIEASSKTDAQFASYNYFIPALYDNLQGISNNNPLYPINELVLRKDTMVLPVADVASFMGKTIEEAVPTLYDMTIMGLLFYDNEAGLVTVNPKLNDFADARAKKKDYDPIIFESDIKGNNDVSGELRDIKRDLAEIELKIKEQKEQQHNTDALEKEKARLQKRGKELVDGMKNAASSNATLNLSNLDLIIRGVKRVTLSDSQYVRVYPFNQEVVVKKNRDFIFSGAVNVGSTEFFGSNLSYEYAENKINLPQADSMRIRVHPFGDKRRQQPQVRVTSVIKSVRGTIFLDLKDNKSGNKRGNEKYPILDCIKESYVYYNKPSIYNGVYDSSKFFFKIAPFKMDSLDNFKISGVAFAGDFYSAGILPPIKETLRVQKDYSLGFIRKAPPEGFSLYGDKAKFNNDIRLSDKGLTADGELNFLTSYAQSTDFVLFPDSISGIAQKYENKEQMAKKPGELNVPHVVGKNVKVTFVPKAKVFYAQTVETTMKTYNDQSDFRGRMTLRAEGLTAQGRFIFGKADLKAKVMRCKARTIDSDTADFRIKSLDDPNQIAIGGPNLNAHIDFDQRFGEFKKNNSKDYLTLGEIQYICYMDRFKWFMDNEDIQLESDKKKPEGIAIDTDLDFDGSNFYSIHKDQDSLNFMAPKARYDIKKKMVTCEKVDYITVADARIEPDSNKIIVRKNAEMDEFKNAKIVANYITKYHSIFNAKVKITAKRKYRASGDYTYIDENKFEQKIHFDNISPDSTFQTFAKGEVSEKEKFALSPNFEYKGKVILKAADIGLNFDGYTRIAHNCKDVARNWFQFKAVIDPQNVMIPIETNLLSDNKKALGSGFYVNQDTSDVYSYPAFLSEKHKETNANILVANGFLIFDKTTNEYKIGSLDKLKELSLPGNYVALNKNTCKVDGDGKFTFLSFPGVFKFDAVGTVEYKNKETNAKLAMMINFPFNDNVLEKFANKFRDSPDAIAVEVDKTQYAKALREIIGLEKSDKVLQDISLYAEIKKWPPEIAQGIFITDVNFKWNPLSMSYVSTGVIGIGHIFKKEVFKYANSNSKIEVVKRKNDDIVKIYLELDETNWFFLEYSTRKQEAEVYFSDQSLNDAIAEMKDDKKKFKGEKGEKDFEYKVGSKSKAIAFRGSE